MRMRAELSAACRSTTDEGLAARRARARGSAGQVAVRSVVATAFTLLALLATNVSWAQSCPPGMPCGRPVTVPQTALPPPTVTDIGVSQNAVTSIGYSSGAKVGGGISFSLRASTWPYTQTWGIDAFEIDVLAAVSRREIGWRFHPIGFVISVYSRSVFENAYLRWNLIDFGTDYRTDVHESRLSVGTSVSFGYSIELTDGIAIRVLEVGTFGGYYDNGNHSYDVGLLGATGLTFR